MKSQNYQSVIELIEYLTEVNHRLSCNRNNPSRLGNVIQDVINSNTKLKNDLLRGLPDEAFQRVQRKRLKRVKNHSVRIYTQ